jgi:hypothetical protein
LVLSSRRDVNPQACDQQSKDGLSEFSGQPVPGATIPPEKKFKA